MRTNIERFANEFFAALHLDRWVPKNAEVTARRNPDGTITVAWDATVAVSQRGDVLIVDAGIVPAKGGSVNLAVVRGDAPTLVWEAK